MADLAAVNRGHSEIPVLLISPDPYPIPSDASTCRHPIHSPLTDFSENVFQSSSLYRNRLFGKYDSMVMF